MAVAKTNLLQEADTAGGDPVVTAGSVTVTSGRFYLVTVISSTSPTVAGITMPGTVTMTEVLNHARGTIMRVSVWSGQASGTGTGTVSVDFSAATTGTSILVDEVTGHDTVGTVVQSAGNNGLSGTASATLAAFGDAVNNAVYEAVGWALNTTVTPEAGYTQLGHAGHNTPARTGLSAWKIGEDLSPSATAASDQWAIVGLEIKVAAAAAPASMLPNDRRSRRNVLVRM